MQHSCYFVTLSLLDKTVLCLMFFLQYDQRRLEDAEGEVSLVHEARLLALPGVVSCGNLLLPGLFNLMSWMENFNSPIVCLYVSIFR